MGQGEETTLAPPPADCPVPPKPAIGRYLAAGFYACVLVALASFGAGRLFDLLAPRIQAIRQYRAAYALTQAAYRKALHINTPHPSPNPAIPHVIVYYPPLAQRLDEQGTVILKVLVLANGTVGDVEVVRSSGYTQLDAAALVEVGAWAYIPAIQNHRPVAAWTLVAINFRLSR